jgi:hypothetical protein
MSGLIVACSRPGTDLPFSAEDVRTVAARLSPDHIAPRAPLVVEEPGLAVAVVNPIPDLPRAPGAVCLGGLVGGDGGWSATGAGRPDGSYAVCRWDSGRLELVTDNLASRTIWYVLDGDVFLASTSQRALVSLLGDFRLSSGAVAWLASSGSLGPDGGWDTRLRMAPPAAVLTLDRRTWTTRCAAESLDPHPEALPDKVHLQRWRDAILETCRELEVSLDTWLLPLSGGLDSRVLLAALIAADRRPRCVTWGLRRSLDDPANDAVVARRLAEHYRLDHRFLATDMDDTPARVVIDRFLAAGEGRTDQIAGYLDGLCVWKTLYEDGVSGIIRGDEPAWGYTTIYTDADVTRRADGGAVVADYPQGHLIRQLGLAPQSLPAWMARGDGETLQHYASRLWERHGFQAHLAPLNDVKAAYVEIVNPFVSDRVMTVARALPETLRSQRRGFKAVAAGLSPPIPVAKHSAIDGASRLLSSSAPVIDEITAVLSSPEAERICDRQGLDRVSSALRTPGSARAEPRVVGAVRAAVPRRVKAALRPRPPATLSAFKLAFRLHLAIRMATMLEADAAVLRDGAGRPARPPDATRP